MHKIDQVEKDKRVRIVQEWLIDDWPVQDIITQIKTKWGLEERQAKRYIADARDGWNEAEQEKVDHKRRRKIAKLNKLIRSLRKEWEGTPQGIRATLDVEKVIIELEGIQPAQKVEITGKDGGPVIKQVMIVNGKEIEF
jgi:hypothetical protein